MSPSAPRQSRSALAPCADCAALCCRYLATEIEAPRSKRDYDDVRWYLLHRGVSVFLDAEGAWFLAFSSPCRELDDRGRCRRYPTRPHLCREHGRPQGICEYYGPLYRVRFTTAEEFEHWLDAQGTDWRYRSPRRGRGEARVAGVPSADPVGP